ncbi:MAG: autotransporter-associated beta strand repeat-containing protein, partial [Planctomycetia bacterium]|nr:autotransporter-associated beta strand repeat-containing protein [Planctomycetia bacterium]
MGWGEVSAQYTISDGETKTLADLGASTTGFETLTVESGGTLQLANGNTGSTSDTITITGTGDGTVVGTTPHGAIYSPIVSGVWANVVIDGSASVTSYAENTGSLRLRFQGNVTGGELTTYATQSSGVANIAEIHAGMTSTFNISKLIVAQGNFTFCGVSGTDSVETHTHYFAEGITVNSGANLRSWSEKRLYLYTSTEETDLATITLSSGSSYRSENTANTLFANFVLNGSTTFSGYSTLDIGSSDAAEPNTCISGTGTLNVNGITLSLHDGNTYSGGTGIGASATLRISHANATGTGTVTLNEAGRLELDGIAEGMTFELGGLAGGGVTTVYSGSANNVTLQVGSANGSQTYSGVLSNSSGKMLSVEKVGTGTWTLTGNSTYTGNTTISGGTLDLQGSLASTQQVQLNSGATLRLSSNASVPGGVATQKDTTTRLIFDGYTVKEGTWAIRAGSTTEIGEGGLNQTGGNYYIAETTFTVSEGVTEATASYNNTAAGSGSKITLDIGSEQTLNFQTVVKDYIDDKGVSP